MVEPKIIKKLFNLFTKITYVFTDFYIFKNGYILSTDKEKPFLIQLKDSDINLFKEVMELEAFSIIHIPNIRELKKVLGEESKKDFYYEVTLPSEKKQVIELLTEKVNYLNSCENMERFYLSDSKEENEKLVDSLFKNNTFVTFKPNGSEDNPEIILTKSLLPLVSEKNYTNLWYTTKKLENDLHLIIFDFDFEVFRVSMFHFYVEIDFSE